MIVHHRREEHLDPKSPFYTLHYGNGCRADRRLYQGDEQSLAVLCSSVANGKGRTVYLRRHMDGRCVLTGVYHPWTVDA